MLYSILFSPFHYYNVKSLDKPEKYIKSYKKYNNVYYYYLDI